jgi:hypothetical protein
MMQPVWAFLDAISRQFRRRPVGFVLLAHTVATLAGCAQLNPTRTGYLTDYSQLQVTEKRIPLVRPRVVESGCPGAEALKDVDSFFIEPIGWEAGEVVPGSFEETCRENLSNTLRASLTRELGALKPVVDEPGTRTARVRAAVTQVAYARPLLNSALTVVAVPIFNGGGVVEAEVIAPDDRQIAAVVAALPGRAFDVMGFYTWQGHAEKAMRRSARRLCKLLAKPPAPVRSATGYRLHIDPVNGRCVGSTNHEVAVPVRLCARDRVLRDRALERLLAPSRPHLLVAPSDLVPAPFLPPEHLLETGSEC